MRIFLALLAVAGAAAPAEAQALRPTLAEMRAQVGATPPVITRVAFVDSIGPRARSVPVPAEWDAPHEVAVASGADLDFTLGLNDLPVQTPRKEWARVLARMARADLLISAPAGAGKSWTLTAPDGSSRTCAPGAIAGGYSRWVSCLGFDGVVVAAKDGWYLVHAYRRDVRRATQALLLRDSATSMMIGNDAIPGDGLLNAVEAVDSYVLLKAITRSSGPVGVGTKVIFEASTGP